MPRFFDSDAQAEPLWFTENVECAACGEIFEGMFFDYTRSLTVQDMTDPPVGVHQCPRCGAEFRSAMTGWTFYSEAG